MSLEIITACYMGQQTKVLNASEETQKGFASYISLNLFLDTELPLQVM